jgi:hypothetical protein
MSRTISITFGEKLSKWKEGERKETKRNKKGSPLAVVRRIPSTHTHTQRARAHGAHPVLCFACAGRVVVAPQR